jgi:hypothetical protein
VFGWDYHDLGAAFGHYHYALMHGRAAGGGGGAPPGRGPGGGWGGVV